MDDPKITLGGKAYPVNPIPLGRLKKLVPAFARAGQAFARGEVTDAAMDDMVTVISAGIGIEVAKVEEIPATMDELKNALPVISEVAGLKPPEAPEGNARGAKKPRSTGTTSTRR